MRKIVLTFGLMAGAILSTMMLITLPFQEQLEEFADVLVIVNDQDDLVRGRGAFHE